MQTEDMTQQVFTEYACQATEGDMPADNYCTSVFYSASKFDFFR